MTTTHDHTTDAPGQTVDDAEADYIAYVGGQEAALTGALADALVSVHRASRALFELIELDAPGWTQTTEGDDATADLTEAARAIRAADRCAHVAVQ